MSQHCMLFYTKIDGYYSDQNKKKPFTAAELNEIAGEILSAKQTPGRKSRRQYHLLTMYDVLDIGDRKVVIKKQKGPDGNHISMVCYEDLFNILYETHISVGHGGRDKMIHALQTKYDVARYAVEKLIETCEVCQKKRNKSNLNLTAKPNLHQDEDTNPPSLNSKSTTSDTLNSRGQVNLINFQTCPYDDYKWLLKYQDQLTKFLFLRPLKSETPKEVGRELLKIFLEIGAPTLLQSDRGREFTNSIISELTKMWPNLKVLNGRPRYPHSNQNDEGTNQDVESLLRAWMHDNNSTNWFMGCYFVQFQINTSYNTVIACTPYKALFGVEPKAGLVTRNVPGKLLDSIEDEDELIRLMEITEGTKEDLQDLSTDNYDEGRVYLENENKSKNGKDDKEENEGLLTYEKENIIINPDVDSPKQIHFDKIENHENLEMCVNNESKFALCRDKTPVVGSCNKGQKRTADDTLSWNSANKQTRLKINSYVLT